MTNNCVSGAAKFKLFSAISTDQHEEGKYQKYLSKKKQEILQQYMDDPAFDSDVFITNINR